MSSCFGSRPRSFGSVLGELLAEPVGHLHRRVRRVEGQVAEERARRWFCSMNVQRVVGEVVGDEALAAHELAVVLQRRVEVLRPSGRR